MRFSGHIKSSQNSEHSYHGTHNCTFNRIGARLIVQSLDHSRDFIAFSYNTRTKKVYNNWRPISLLNVDYKIASACLANRMKHILDKHISETQTGFLQGQSI